MRGPLRLVARRPRRTLAAVAGIGLLGLVGAVGTSALLRTDASADGQRASVKAFTFPGSPGTRASAHLLGAATPLPTTATAAPRAAVAAYLGARTAGNDRAAYELLPTATRARYGSLAQWSFALTSLPRPTSFRLLGPPTATTGGVAVPVQVRQVPRLDAISGYVPARSNDTYLALRGAHGWLVEPDPIDSVAGLPADSGAGAAARAWVSARTACDQRASRALQYAGQLLGAPDLAAAPCTTKGTWRVGGTSRLVEGPSTRAFLAAFGSGVDNWSRLVEVVGPPGHFFLAVAPLGERWRVFGLLANANGS